MIKNKAFQVLTILVLIAFAMVATKRVFFNKNFEKTMENSTLQTEITPSLTPTPEKKEQKYTFEIISQSVQMSTRPYEGEARAKISNISVEPYITNFSFRECTYVDDEGTEYQGWMDGDHSLEKAILPDESITLTFGIIPNPIGLDECTYQDDGTKKCKVSRNVKIKNCNVNITTNGESASGYESNPTNVKFPL